MRTGRGGSQSGFALIAAIIILSLLVILGMMAMMIGESEMRVVSNLDMDKKLTYIAVQTVDRILSHLHYNPEGPIKLLGVNLYDDNTTILPRLVLDGVGPLVVAEGDGVTFPVKVDDRYVVEASINYKDWEKRGDYVARPVSQPFTIYVRARHRDSHYTKAFAVEVKPITPWDFVYFTQNSEPISGSPGYNNEPIFRHRGKAATVSFVDSYGYCQSTPSFFYNRVIGDIIAGDIYLGGLNAGFFVKGSPVFGGQIWWRTLYPYYDPARNQSDGCSGTCDKHPVLMGGVKPSAPEIRAFERNPQDSFWFATQGSFGVRGIREAANYRFSNAVIDNKHYAIKILFLHNLDTNGNGICEDGRCAAVGSAITPSLNNGQVDDAGDAGAMIVWRVRWEHPNAISDTHQPIYTSGNFLTTRWYRAALMGDNLDRRMIAILGADDNNCVYNSNVRSCGNLQCLVPSSAQLSWSDLGGIYGNVVVRPAMVPDFGHTCSGVGGNGSYPYNSSVGTGIIFVEGDVIVSGVLDGRVSIFATGDIILDHEIEYEKHPLRYPNDLEDLDMLGLFARGDVLIPEHIAVEYPTHPTYTYPDDWSDPLLGDGNFAPQGWFDSGDSNDVSVVGPLMDDDGSEDLHAVIHAAGYECAYLTDGSTDCAEWNSASLRGRKQQARQDMRVGFYALPKTTGRGGLAIGNPLGRPFLRLIGDNYYEFHNMANQSGPLRLVGAIIQNYPGRVGYDYHTGGANPTWNGKPTYVNSSCTDATSSITYTCQYDETTQRYYWAKDNDASEPCNVIGHESFEATYDPRLRLTHPPMPFDAAYGFSHGSNQVPKGAWWFGYGMAAYEVL
ncbi:MAG TPA: hypothetical protein ENF73_05310, partial [Proteobacteria bacterium]|nr:hypothetical protein [Pseudomonadota bacterium]